MVLQFCYLKPGSWQAYVTENRAFDGTWIFQHVPKTAGSSITASLARYAAPYKNIAADRASSIPVREQYRDLAVSTPLDVDGKRLRSLSGHLWKREIDTLIARQPECRLLTFVREPVRRVVSDYRYSRTAAHSGWEQQIKDFPDFDTYIDRSPAVKNKTTFFLTGLRDGDPEEVINSIFSRFNYIGVLEQIDLSYAILAKIIGVKDFGVKHMRPTESTKENSIEPTREQIERIRSFNYLDEALFNRVNELHSSMKCEIVGSVGE